MWNVGTEVRLTFLVDSDRFLKAQEQSTGMKTLNVQGFANVM